MGSGNSFPLPIVDYRKRVVMMTLRAPRLVSLLLVVMALSGCSLSPVGTTSSLAATSSTKPLAQWQVYFSPNGGATEAVVRTLSKAKKTVLVQAYSFTSAPIAKALLEAKKRGVDVRVILDKGQKTAKYSSADFFRNTGVPVFIDDAHAIAHNKIMIIDGVTVITGSFNFTKAAEERNAENLLIIRDKKLALAYTKNWKEHFAHSEPYRGRNR